MTDRDLYADLEVAREATADEIRTAYRKLAREHHPDVNPNDPKAEERFKRVSFANTVLSDPEKRARYDEFGMAGLSEGFDPEQARSYQRWSHGTRQSPHFESFSSDVDLDELLSSFFQSTHDADPGPARGRDAEATLQIEFLDAILGATVPVHLQGRPALQVKIPPGARQGSRVRLAGQGGPGRHDGPRGDLYLELDISPHPYFERNGDDLTVSLPVTLPELTLGGSVEVPTPHGDVDMTIPTGARNGQRLRLRGKGVPARPNGTAGDLFVTLDLVLPKGHDDELRKLAEQFEPLYSGENPREHMIHVKQSAS